MHKLIKVNGTQQIAVLIYSPQVPINDDKTIINGKANNPAFIHGIFLYLIQFIMNKINSINVIIYTCIKYKLGKMHFNQLIILLDF